MLLIKNGRVIDPLSHLDQVMDLLIDEGKIIEMGHIEKDCETIDAKDMIVAPGLIDNHVHFRDPGLTYKEDIYTGSNAAKAGGFTAVGIGSAARDARADYSIIKLSDLEKIL